MKLLKVFIRKNLSILLVLALIIGSVSIATGAIRPAVWPASVQSDLNNLRAAYAAMEAAGAREQWTFTANPATDPNANPAGGFNMTITDLSPGGYVWRVVEAFEQLIQNDEFLMVGHDTGEIARDARLATPATNVFPYTWWSHVYFELATYLFGSTRDARRSLLGAMTNMRRNALPITNATDSARAMNAMSRDAQWANAGTGTNLGNTRTTVNRSEIIALRDVADWDALLALPPEGVRTAMTFGIDAGNMIREGNLRFNYFRERVPTTYVYSYTQIENLMEYYDHFFANGTLDINPFVLSTGDLANLIAENTAATNAVSAFPAADLERFFGAQALEAVAEFIQACADALNISDFLPHIQFFQDPGGFIDRIASGTYYNPADMAEMSGIWAGMEFHFQRLNSMSSAGRDQLAVLYGLDFPAIVAARAVLQRHMNLHELATLWVAIDAHYTANFPGVLFFRPDAPEDAGDVDGVDYFSDAWLTPLVAQYNAFYAALNNFPTEHVLEIFTDGIDHIILFRLALNYEANFRSLESDLRDILVFFGHYLTTDLAAIGTNQLINILNEAIGFSNVFFNLYEEMADGLTPEDREFIFGNFPDIIPMVTHQIFLTLEGRFVAQVETALALYENVGAVSWENVALLRRMIGFIESPIFNRLAGTVYIPQHIREAYLRLRGEILDDFQEFTRDGGFHSFETHEPDYPVRAPRTTDIARATDFEVTGDSLNSVVERLNAYLASDAFVELTDINLAEMLGDLIDGLWSDAVINTIMQVVYPELLGAFEQEWYNLPDYEADDSGMFVHINKQVMRTALGNTAAGNTFWHGNANNAGLRLYPDHLAIGLSGAGFTAAAAALGSVTTSPSGAWTIYPTNAWSHSNITDDYGNLNLRWGVDDPDDVDISGWDALSQQERFAHALSEAMRGLWPVLASLLAGQTYTGTVYFVAQMHGFANDTLLCSNPNFYNPPGFPHQNMRSNVRAQRIYLDLNVFDGTHGYAELLTPIFEALMGEDAAGLALIPTTAELEAMTQPRQLVDAILNPVIYFATELLPSAPLETLLNVLPNVAFALTMDNISPLFRHLALNLDYRADGRLDVRCVTTTSGWNPNVGGTMGSQGMAIYDGIVLDLYEVFFGGDLDLGFLRDFNAILDMIVPLFLPEIESLPLFNAGTLATMGELIGPIASNRPSGERFTIRANQGDVLLHLLRYVGEVLQVNDLFEFVTDLLDDNALIGGILANIAEYTDDVIAALVELIAPNLNDHPLTEISFGPLAPQGSPFPSWWAGLDPDGATMAQLDAEFIVNNASAVLDVLWRTQTSAEPFTVGVYNLINEYFGPASLFVELGNLLRPMLATFDLADLLSGLGDFEALLELMIIVDGTPLSVQQLFSEVEALLAFLEDSASVDSLAATINDFDDFVREMSTLLLPIEPILDFLLFGANLELIDIFDWVEVAPGEYERDSVGGLITLRGYEGFAYGLVPIFNAFMLPLGVSPVVAPTLADSAQDKIEAILNPIVEIAYALLESDDVVVDVLRLLPSIVHFLSPDADGGDSPLQQSVDNLLHPIYVVFDTLRPIIDVTAEFGINGLVLSEGAVFFTEIGSESPGGRLIVDLLGVLNDLVATIPLGGEYFEVDLRRLMQGELSACGRYFAADPAAVLFALLEQIGLLDEIERLGWIALTELIHSLLNTPGRERPEIPSSFSWPYPNRRDTNDLYHVFSWTRNTGMRAATQLPILIDNIWPVIIGDDTITDTIYNLLGDSVFTQANFDMIVALVQDLLAELPLDDIDGLIPGRTLRELLYGLVMIGEENIDLLGILDDLAAFPGATVTDQDSFIDGMIAFLLPVAPALGWLLFGEDVVLLGGHDDINNGNGLLSVFGHDGYRFGLIPLLESVLMPLGGGAHIVSPAEMADRDAEGRVRGLLQPILYVLERVVEDPVDTVIRLLPNVGYLLSQGVLQMSIDMLLLGVNGIFAYVSDEPLIELELVPLLDEILGGIGLYTLSHRTLANLQTGTIITFESMSGAIGHFMMLYCEEDESDLLSALLRELIHLAQYNRSNRTFIIDAITDLIAPGNRLIRWGLQFVLFVGRVIGTSLSMRVVLNVIRVVNVLWNPIISRFF